MIDVPRLRAEAAQRARERPRLTFTGHIDEHRIAGRPVRSYEPAAVQADAPWVVFLHGGYGMLGDLELQDPYCRLLSQTLVCHVVAVDYRLAPEHTLSESTADAASVAAQLRHERARPIVLAGDSAGGAVALSAALELQPDLAGLLLTNPNIDLTLASYDRGRPAGPDLDLSQYAFRAWTRSADLADAPRLQDRAVELPAVFVAVGDQDSLLPECAALVSARTRAGLPAQLLTLPGAGHGFISDPGSAAHAVDAMSAFLDAAGCR